MTDSPRLPRLELNETPPFPRCLEIQTTNVCNARCGVCPYAETTAVEKKARMDDELLARVISECAERRDELELIVPYFNNEPLADRRMLDILRTLRRRVRVPVELSTNASLLDEARARAILAEELVQVLRVSLFGSDRESYERRMKKLSWQKTSRRLRRFLSLRSELESPLRVELIMIGEPSLSRDEVKLARSMWEPLGAEVHIFGYLDRAGNNRWRNLLPRHQGWARLLGCELNRPFERMALRAGGEAVLCSQDWGGDVVLGHLGESTLADIWTSDAYRRARDQIAGHIEAPADLLCRSCKLAFIE